MAAAEIVTAEGLPRFSCLTAASLNRELIKDGLACWFRKYSEDLRLGGLERQAREAKRGLWREPHPVSLSVPPSNPPPALSLLKILTRPDPWPR